MANLDGWDWALLAAAGYVAVMALVRMMRGHHDFLVNQFRERLENEEERRQEKQRRERAEEDPLDQANEAA